MKYERIGRKEIANLSEHQTPDIAKLSLGERERVRAALRIVVDYLIDEHKRKNPEQTYPDGKSCQQVSALQTMYLIRDLLGPHS